MIEIGYDAADEITIVSLKDALTNVIHEIVDIEVQSKHMVWVSDLNDDQIRDLASFYKLRGDYSDLEDYQLENLRRCYKLRKALFRSIKHFSIREDFKRFEIELEENEKQYRKTALKEKEI